MSANSLVMERLKTVMLSDANSSMDTLNKVLRSDLYSLLSEYMSLEPESLGVNFEVDEGGMIRLCITANTHRLYDAGYTLPD